MKPWLQSDLSHRKIRIGIMKTDGHVKPVQSIQRALTTAAAKLAQSSDFEVVPYEMSMAKEAWEIIVSVCTQLEELISRQSKLYWPDKGKIVFDHIAKSGEPILPLTQWIIDHTKHADGTLEENLAVRFTTPIDLVRSVIDDSLSPAVTNSARPYRPIGLS